MARIKLKFRVLPDGATHQVEGREAWTLGNLVRYGLKGFSVFDNPGPRLSHYVMKLRRLGLNIETVDVRHGGPFPGVHCKYLLKTQVEIIEETHPETTPNAFDKAIRDVMAGVKKGLEGRA